MLDSFIEDTKAQSSGVWVHIPDDEMSFKLRRTGTPEANKALIDVKRTLYGIDYSEMSLTEAQQQRANVCWLCNWVITDWDRVRVSDDDEYIPYSAPNCISNIYNNEGTWQNLAPIAELYDVDVCGGHAAGTDYHHHFYSACLADLLGDDGTKHSPLYGYAADGYPIYGPYEADGELAVSAWSLRDYSASSETGCSDGERSCTLVDQHDISLGTEESNTGAGFDEEVTSLSSNTFIATNGYYYEDYYWNSDLTDLGGNYLDQHNGHTSDELGYHYHITLTKDEDGTVTPAFPYIIGPRFAGELEDNAVASCGSSTNTPPPRS